MESENHQRINEQFDISSKGELLERTAATRLAARAANAPAERVSRSVKATERVLSATVEQRTALRQRATASATVGQRASDEPSLECDGWNSARRCGQTGDGKNGELKGDAPHGVADTVGALNGGATCGVRTTDGRVV